jgi:hypothetical protein
MTIYCATWENTQGVHRKYYDSRIGAYRATRYKSRPIWYSITEIKDPQGVYQIVKLLNREVSSLNQQR